MQPGIWIKYLFGQAEAIQRVAASRAALWTGIALVLLTSVARNYDQTLIAEKPFLWFFGSLVFSFFSATWLYVATYKTFARRTGETMGDLKPSGQSGWPSFLGLFWMTAPVAWLYAIPVERFFGTLTAARANLLLLAIVSLWRVLLMARVLQVTTRASFGMTLSWVLFAAAVETLVIVFFGGAFAQAIVRGMGGMRNSPEEELVMRTMSTAFLGALIIAPVALVVSLAWRPKGLLQPLPMPVAEKVCWAGLLAVAAIWIALAVVPQRELANNVAVERLLAEGRTRAALDFVAARQPDDFAPARPLPPKMFERSALTELPAWFGELRASDPPWVRAQAIQKFQQMLSHLGPRWRPAITDSSQPRAQQIKTALEGFQRYGPDAQGLKQLVDGLERIPEGRAWLATNGFFLETIWQAALFAPLRRGAETRPQGEQLAGWLVLSNQLAPRFFTNAPPE